MSPIDADWLKNITPGDMVEFFIGSLGWIVGQANITMIMPSKLPMTVAGVDEDGVTVKERNNVIVYYRVLKKDIRYHFPHYSKK